MFNLKKVNSNDLVLTLVIWANVVFGWHYVNLHKNQIQQNDILIKELSDKFAAVLPR